MFVESWRYGPIGLLLVGIAIALLVVTRLCFDLWCIALNIRRWTRNFNLASRIVTANRDCMGLQGGLEDSTDMETVGKYGGVTLAPKEAEFYRILQGFSLEIFTRPEKNHGSSSQSQPSGEVFNSEALKVGTK